MFQDCVDNRYSCCLLPACCTTTAFAEHLTLFPRYHSLYRAGAHWIPVPRTITALPLRLCRFPLPCTHTGAVDRWFTTRYAGGAGIYLLFFPVTSSSVLVPGVIRCHCTAVRVVCRRSWSCDSTLLFLLTTFCLRLCLPGAGWCRSSNCLQPITRWIAQLYTYICSIVAHSLWWIPVTGFILCHYCLPGYDAATDGGFNYQYALFPLLPLGVGSHYLEVTGAGS